jgi:hypothetical protein
VAISYLRCGFHVIVPHMAILMPIKQLPRENNPATISAYTARKHPMEI